MAFIGHGFGFTGAATGIYGNFPKSGDPNIDPKIL